MSLFPLGAVSHTEFGILEVHFCSISQVQLEQEATLEQEELLELVAQVENRVTVIMLHVQLEVEIVMQV